MRVKLSGPKELQSELYFLNMAQLATWFCIFKLELDEYLGMYISTKEGYPTRRVPFGTILCKYPTPLVSYGSNTMVDIYGEYLNII